MIRLAPAWPANPEIWDLPLLPEANAEAVIPLGTLLALHGELPALLECINPASNQAPDMTLNARIQHNHVPHVDKAVHLVSVLDAYCNATVPDKKVGRMMFGVLAFPSKGGTQV